MAETPTNADSSNITAPTGGGSGGDMQGSQIADDPKRQIEALIAAGNFEEAAKITGAPTELLAYAQTKRDEIKGVEPENSAPSQEKGSSAAPAVKDENAPEQPKEMAAPAASPEMDNNIPSATSLINRASDTLDAFVVALKNGASYGQELIAATKQAIQFNVVDTNVKTAETDQVPQTDNNMAETASRAAEVASRAAESVQSNAQEALANLVKAGSFGALWDAPGSKADLGGTGNFAALGNQNATTLTDPGMQQGKGGATLQS